MAHVQAETRLSAPAAAVWDRVGDFNAVQQWHPAISASRLEDGGTVRRVSVAGGGESVERLTARDDAARRYSYELVSGPMPVSRYRATLAVEDDQDGGSRVRWSAEYTPAGAAEADARAAIGGFLRAGLDNLRQLYQ